MMMVSDLIRELQAVMDEGGDRPVLVEATAGEARIVMENPGSVRFIYVPGGLYVPPTEEG